MYVSRSVIHPRPQVKPKEIITHTNKLLGSSMRRHNWKGDCERVICVNNFGIGDKAIIILYNMIITNFRYIYIHNLSNISTFSLSDSRFLKPTHPSHSLFDSLGFYHCMYFYCSCIQIFLKVLCYKSENKDYLIL